MQPYNRLVLVRAIPLILWGVTTTILFFPLGMEDKIIYIAIMTNISSTTSIGALYVSTEISRKVIKAEYEGKKFVNEVSPRAMAIWPRAQAALEAYSTLTPERKEDVKRGVALVVDLLEGKLKRLTERPYSSE